MVNVIVKNEKKQNKTVMGIHAAPAKPDWRGFAILGLAFGGPVVVALFWVDTVF